MRTISVAGLVLLASVEGYSQPAAGHAEQGQAFDVASVKVSQIGRAGGEGSRREKVDHTPGSLTMRNVSLKSAIQWAYNVKNYQVTGPGWLETERYDVVGKAAAEVGEDQLRLMLQTLLTDRFKLAFHREEKVLPVYALVVGKGGPKFKESETQGEMTMQPGGRGKFTGIAQRITMAQAVDLLSQSPLGRPVVDETGLKGRYDITIDVAAYLGNEDQMKQIQADPTQLIFNVIQEQLGLKLEPKKSTVQMLIVDGAEKAPTEN
jgi:uncharacterized protein (TIGR03435 family)